MSRTYWLKAIEYPSGEENELGDRFRSPDRALSAGLKWLTRIRGCVGGPERCTVQVIDPEDAVIAELTVYGGTYGQL